MKKIIHVNQHIIRSNKTGKKKAPITCKTYKSNTKGFEVEIIGMAKVVYRPNKPLPCGAKVWLETVGVVFVDGKEVT